MRQFINLNAKEVIIIILKSYRKQLVFMIDALIIIGRLKWH